MSAVNSDVPGGTDGRNAESSRGTADPPKVTPGSELPHPANSGISGISFQQGKVPLHAIYTNGFRVPPGSVRQQPQVPGKQRVGSAASVCSKSSRKSCKSTASQIQEVAGDDLCATLLLACLFCQFSDLLPLLPGCFCSCPPLQCCNSMLLGLCSDPRCCCCCCGTDGAVAECCYQTDCCTHCALACLFCEFISLCSLALDCLGCGGCLKVCCSGDGGESLAECCCCKEAGGGNCPCGFGCGMLQDCCSSSDCVEICLECCSICFPS